MKSIYSLALMVTVTLAVAQTGHADDSSAVVQTNHPDEPVSATQTGHPDEFLFRANELSVDLFGTVSVGQYTVNHISGDRVRDDGRLGAGAGINYFITRYVGIGGDAYTENTKHSFVDNASGNLIFRIPIDTLHLAPYVYGGAGYQFDTADRCFGQAGAGLEVRITKNFGIFADARYVFIKDTPDLGLGRAGVRFSF